MSPYAQSELEDHPVSLGVTLFGMLSPPAIFGFIEENSRQRWVGIQFLQCFLASVLKLKLKY